jgi:hypothetical protein
MVKTLQIALNNLVGQRVTSIMFRLAEVVIAFSDGDYVQIFSNNAELNKININEDNGRILLIKLVDKHIIKISSSKDAKEVSLYFNEFELKLIGDETGFEAFLFEIDGMPYARF